MPFSFERDVQVVPGGTGGEAPTVTPSAVPEQLPSAFQFEKPAPTPTLTPELPKPDQAARDKQLSEQTGLPGDLVSQARNEAEMRAAQKDLDTTLSQSPITTEFMASDPQRLAISQDDAPGLSFVESLGRRFEIGRAQQRLLVEAGEEAQLRAFGLDTGDRPQVVADLQKELEDLNIPADEGLLGWLSSAATVLGQQAESFLSPEAAERVTAGALTGGLASLGTSGPLAPITTPVGLAAGAGAGVISHFAIESMTAGAGEVYTEALESGVDQRTASIVAATSGILIGGLDVIGVAPGAKFVSSATKDVFKRAVKKAATDKRFIKVATDLATQYGFSVAAETVTEGIQEAVIITANQVAQELSDIERQSITAEEAQERILGAMEEAFKAATVLAAAPTGTAIIGEVRKSRQATVEATQLREVATAAKETKTAQRAPEVAGDHLSEVLRRNKVEDVLIPAEQLRIWLDQSADPQALAVQMGVADKVGKAQVLGQDVKVKGDLFAKHAMMHENFDALSSHVRMDDTAMTEAEAQEYMDSGLQSDVEDSLTIETPPDTDPDIDMAEHEQGLKGLFQTAEEAGMSEKEYADYLTKQARANDRSNRLQEQKRLKQAERELTDEWKAELANETSRVTETLRNERVYQSIDNIQRDRLDQSTTAELLSEMGRDLNDLPVKDKRRLYAPKTEQGIDPEFHAQTLGYNNAFEMLDDMIRSEPIETVAAVRARENMLQKHGDLNNRITALQEARASVMNDDYADVLRLEMNWMRVAQKQKRIGKAQIKTAAKAQLKKEKVKDVKPIAFERASARAGKAARKALRSGDREAASRHKLAQLVNFEMAREAHKVAAKQQRDIKFLRKRRKFKKKGEKLPVKYQQAITQLLRNVSIADKPGPKRLKELLAVANSKTDPAKVPSVLIDLAKPIRYDEMSVDDFAQLVDTVKEIDKKGREENKFRNQQRQAQVIEDVAAVAEAIETNVGQDQKTRQRLLGDQSRWDKIKRGVGKALGSIYFAGTITKILDGGKEGGVAHSILKAPMERALNHGYLPGKVGYNRRSREVAQNIEELYRPFTKKDRLDLRKVVEIPGAGRMTNEKRLSILLNSGNAENIRAMTASGQITEKHRQAVVDHASAKDWKFVQGVWDYMDSFWNEIVETEQRRRNYTPEKVQAQSIDTEHGTFKGGYYPIRYDRDTVFSPLNLSEEQEAMDRMQLGDFVRSHTQRGHTEQRTGANGASVKLDLFVINQHLEQVTRDLELGDALTDIYKVLFHEDTKRSFQGAGLSHLHEQLDLWFRDSVTGEIGQSNVAEGALRRLRTGFTVAKLGWNVGVALMQPLGLIQSSVRVGHGNMRAGVRAWAKGKKFGQNSLRSWINEQSGFMEGRDKEFNKDIVDAQTATRPTIVDRLTPGDSKKIVIDSFFAPIRAMQGQVDTIVWMAGYKRGLVQSDGNHQAAVEMADRIVAESQGSGIFTERSAVERGSVTRGVRQTEFVRAFTPLISYFIAKNNTIRQRAIGVDFKNPVEFAAFVRDFMLMFVVEAILSFAIRESLRATLTGDEVDEDELVPGVVGEVASTITGGLPLVREVTSGIQGFSAGGVFGAFIGETTRASQQVAQGEVDEAALKAINNVTGTLLKYPSSTINKHVLSWLEE